MNPEQAQVYFKKYSGRKFFMFRQEPELYGEYMELNIEPQTEEHWRQEIIRDLLDGFFSQRDSVWAMHSRIIDVLTDTQTCIEQNCRELLMLMSELDSLDLRQRALVIENMAGRREDHKDGGCFLICTRTSLGSTMNSVMERIMGVSPGTDMQIDWCEWNENAQRFADAKRAYRAAYMKYSC